MLSFDCSVNVSFLMRLLWTLSSAGRPDVQLPEGTKIEIVDLRQVLSIVVRPSPH